MMKQRTVLLVGLTAVSLLIFLTSCTQPSPPPATPEPTAQPTSAPPPTSTPEPTPTPTYSQQANQLLLADGRFTTFLDKLRQEIGRDLSDAEQEQVMALARALWLPAPEADLPDHLDESYWLPDPAGMTLHWRPSLDGREGPVLLVMEAQPDSPYAAGAIIFWQEEGLLNLTPGEPSYYFEFGRVQQNNWDFETWIEYDADGNLYSFVHPDTGQYVTPQGDGTVFIASDVGPDGRPTNGQYYWENGGEPTPITTSPQAELSIADFLQNNPHLQLTQTEQAGQQMVTLEDSETGEVRWTLNADMEWEEAVTVEFVGGWGVGDDGLVYTESDDGDRVPHANINEAMERGGLEPLGVQVDEEENIVFDVSFQGEVLQAELKDRHAGIGRAIIVRDAFVSEPNPNMPPAESLRFRLENSNVGTQAVLIEWPQVVGVRADWVVYVNPPVHIAKRGYWQARITFRGFTDGKLVEFTAPFRVGFFPSTGSFVRVDPDSLGRETSKGGILESGNVLINIRIYFVNDNNGTPKDIILDFYQNNQLLSGGEANFLVGSYGVGESSNITYEDVVYAVKSGSVIEDKFLIDSISPRN